MRTGAFCVAEVWSMQDGERRRAQRAMREKGGPGTLLLQAMPFALPFPERLDRFRAWARAEKCVVCVVWCGVGGVEEDKTF